MDGKIVEMVTGFIGSLIPSDGVCDKEIRRIIAMGKAAMGSLMTIWKDRGIKLATEVKLVNALVFQTVLTDLDDEKRREEDN